MATPTPIRTVAPKASRLLRPKEVADYLGLPEHTLAKWRSERRGPPWMKLERLVRYRREDIDEWICTHLQPGGS
jgi:excisionase family DNA binding protein